MQRRRLHQFQAQRRQMRWPPEAPATAADTPTSGMATANTTAADAATTSTSVPESPASVPDAPTSSSEPAAEEELEVVSGRRLLQGPPEGRLNGLTLATTSQGLTCIPLQSQSLVASPRDLF